MNTNKYIKTVREYLSKDRIEHSISTAEFMKENAKTFNIDPKKAYIAGLLHDVAKEMHSSELINLTNKFNQRGIIQLKNLLLKKRYQFLLHGIASAEIMYSLLDIKDKEILESACNHTYGGSELSKLSKYTFMCDYCEPLRTHSTSKMIHKILIKEKNFYKAYFLTYVYLLKRVIKKKKIICPDSIEGYNEALILLETT